MLFLLVLSGERSIPTFIISKRYKYVLSLHTGVFSGVQFLLSPWILYYSLIGTLILWMARWSFQVVLEFGLCITRQKEKMQLSLILVPRKKKSFMLTLSSVWKPEPWCAPVPKDFVICWKIALDYTIQTEITLYPYEL